MTDPSAEPSAPTPPTPAEVVEAIRAGLLRLLPAEDTAQIDLAALDAGTPMLSLPIDSAVLMALMNDLEDRFSVFIDEEAAFSFTTVGEAADHIIERVSAKARRRDGGPGGA